MSQDVFSDINPEVTTGLMLVSLLNDFKDALMSGLNGVERPSQLQAGGFWVDISDQGEPTFSWSLKLFNGVTDLEILRLDVLSGTSGANLATDTFTIRRIAADAVAPILNLMKLRIANSGQVLLDDVVGRFKFVGCDNAAGAPLCAYFQATATDDMTVTDAGAILSFYSTPVGTNTVLEHMRLIGGFVESIKTHKYNSLIWGVDQVASATDIVLNADKVVSEITGVTVSSIHGIEVGDSDTKKKTIMNTTSVAITIEHESLTADAEERFKLPSSLDIIIPANGSGTFYYCTTDLRWKLFACSLSSYQKGFKEYTSGVSSYTATFTGKIRVCAYEGDPENEFLSSVHGRGFYNTFAWGRNQNGQLGLGDVTPRSSPVAVLGGLALVETRIGVNSSYGRTQYNVWYAWGLNANGQLGLGDVTARSSPVAILGSRTFPRVVVADSSYGIMDDGSVYAWGANANGQLGLGDVTPRSSPVAVVGGLKFSTVFTGAEGQGTMFGVQRDTGSLYAWGVNSSGRLGVGDVTPRSSPVAVLGGFIFSKVAVGTDSNVGISSTGVLYGWGLNTNGQLGVGDVTPRSSPVAVVGVSGLVFKDIYTTGASYFAVTTDDTVYSWGVNDSGQLGVGDVTPRSSPIAVLGGFTFERLYVHQTTKSVVASRKGVGSLYAWGLNTNGQLGLGDVTPRSSPVAVLGSLTVVRTNSMGDSFVAFANTGRTYSWGANAHGQLGLGDVTPRSSPVAVIGQPLLSPPKSFPRFSYIPVVLNTTYLIQLNGGRSFFGDYEVGFNVRRLTFAYEN